MRREKCNKWRKNEDCLCRFPEKDERNKNKSRRRRRRLYTKQDIEGRYIKNRAMEKIRQKDRKRLRFQNEQ